MAKVRVYELAKQLGVETKEVVATLAANGIEVKSQNSIEDAAIAIVEKKFKKAEPVKKEVKEAPEKKTEAKKEAAVKKNLQKKGQRPGKRRQSIRKKMHVRRRNQAFPLSLMPSTASSRDLAVMVTVREEDRMVTDKMAIVATVPVPAVRHREESQSVRRVSVPSDLPIAYRRRRNVRRDWSARSVRTDRNARTDVRMATVVTDQTVIVRSVHAKCQKMTVRAAA